MGCMLNFWSSAFAQNLISCLIDREKLSAYATRYCGLDIFLLHAIVFYGSL